MATELSELNQKMYHLKTLFKDLHIIADQVYAELKQHDNDAAQTIIDDINEIIEEAANNGFIELL